MHQNTLPLGQRMPVIQPGNIQKRPRGNQGNNLVHINRRQLPAQKNRPQMTKITVPRITRPVLHLGILAKRRGAAIARRRPDPLVIGRQKIGTVPAQRMPQHPDPVRIRLRQRFQDIHRNRIFIREFSHRRPLRMFLIKPPRIIRLFRRSPLPHHKMVRRQHHIPPPCQMIQIRLLRLARQPRRLLLAVFIRAVQRDHRGQPPRPLQRNGNIGRRPFPFLHLVADFLPAIRMIYQNRLMDLQLQRHPHGFPVIPNQFQIPPLQNLLMKFPIVQIFTIPQQIVPRTGAGRRGNLPPLAAFLRR
ncbi:MAG: hypothetical protein BWY71_00241 [Planctomycetes bacterium ADurb.Bin412]|nr:MAG: hypothetical protein BWY71_00241 [Planctomycetes bacterium ADurb.Bin412]